MRAAPLVLAGLLSAPLAAQGCQRPEPMPGGFPTQFDFVVPVTLSDGYQTFGTRIVPQGPAPACGWPLVVFVHPLGQHRAFDQDLQLLVASQGYAVWTYDVRGHGQAVGANPATATGCTLWGPVELLDLAEHLDFVLGHVDWAGSIDPSRVAVTGSSQGGAHAWSAAAWSGRLLQVPGRPPRTMPTIHCAVAHDLAADPTDDWVRDGVLFSTFFTNVIAGAYAHMGVPFDAAFTAVGRAAFLAQDPGQLLAGLVAEGRATRADLASSVVPVLYTHSYHDFVGGPLPGLEALLATAGPHRALLGTGGHGTPANQAERGFRDGLALRWFNRFLWGIPNEVEFEAPCILAELPLSATVRDDPATAWNRAHLADPLQPTATTRWYLHDDGTLDPLLPELPQAPGTIAQAIDPAAVDFDPTGWLDVPGVRDLANVLQACPLAERVYACTTSTEAQLAHSARVHLRLVPDRAEWMLAALLTVQPPGAGATEVMLGSRAIASRTSTAGVAEEREFLLPPVAARIPAGSTVRLRLRNLWLDEAPMQRQLMTVPLFHDFQVDVVHADAVGGSWLEVPLQPVRPKLVSAATSLDLGTLPPLALQLRGGAERAGLPYLLAVGMGGQVPSIPYLGEDVPIEGDWLVGVSVASQQAPYFTGFLGFLDADGVANGQLDFSSIAPMPTFLTGWCLTAGGFVWDGIFASTGAPTNPLDVVFR
ncbi:MAG: acetylxylan esterase [Planctomycetes bacterium]|nr:acetylxylan esterase [Planctomycetota bacterium]